MRNDFDPVKPVPRPIFGFYEEEYPQYSHEWTNELQLPATADEMNALVAQLRKANQRREATCQGLWGRVFGHNYVTRLDKEYYEAGAPRTSGVDVTLLEGVIEACRVKSRTHRGLACLRCGHIVKEEGQ